MLLIAIAALGLTLTRFHFDASRPPDPYASPLPRIIGLAVVCVPAFFAVLAIVASRGRIIEKIPAALTLPAILILLAVPAVVLARFEKPAAVLTVLWLFFGAGFGEEIFFSVATFSHGLTRHSDVRSLYWALSLDWDCSSIRLRPRTGHRGLLRRPF